MFVASVRLRCLRPSFRTVVGIRLSQCIAYPLLQLLLWPRMSHKRGSKRGTLRELPWFTTFPFPLNASQAHPKTTLRRIFFVSKNARIQGCFFISQTDCQFLSRYDPFFSPSFTVLPTVSSETSFLISLSRLFLGIVIKTAMFSWAGQSLCKCCCSSWSFCTDFVSCLSAFVVCPVRWSFCEMIKNNFCCGFCWFAFCWSHMSECLPLFPVYFSSSLLAKYLCANLTYRKSSESLSVSSMSVRLEPMHRRFPIIYMYIGISANLHVSCMFPYHCLSASHVLFIMREEYEENDHDCMMMKV